MSWTLRSARPCANGDACLPLQWSLVCDSAWKVHIAKFSLLVGSIFGYLVFGILADWWDSFIYLFAVLEKNKVLMLIMLCCRQKTTLIILKCPSPGSAATRCWSYRCCSCWYSVWLWPSPSTCPCSAPCASLRASAWRGSSSRYTSSVSLLAFYAIQYKMTQQYKGVPGAPTRSINVSLPVVGVYATIWEWD